MHARRLQRAHDPPEVEPLGFGDVGPAERREEDARRVLERALVLGLVERAAELGAYAMGRLRALQARCHRVGDVRGRGLLFGVELVTDRDTRMPDHEMAEAVYYRCLDGGVSFKISQGNVLTLSPPLIIARTELDQALDIIEGAILAASSR